MARYIFPGLAMGAHLAGSKTVSDTMLTAASEALPQLIPEEDKKRGCVYPSLHLIRYPSHLPTSHSKKYKIKQ